MKKLLCLFCMAAMAIGMFAQESYTLTIPSWQWNDRCSSLSFVVGAPSVVGCIEQTAALTTINDNRADLYSLGAYQLRYDYNVLRWLAVGGRVSYEGWRCASKTSSEYQQLACHRASVLMEIIFTYINREHVTLYSGVALGMSQMWRRDVLVNGSLEGRHLSHMAGSVVPIGVRVGSSRAYGMAEVSLGSESIMAVGFGFRF